MEYTNIDGYLLIHACIIVFVYFCILSTNGQPLVFRYRAAAAATLYQLATTVSLSCGRVEQGMQVHHLWLYNLVFITETNCKSFGFWN